jgi:hypothetical protein
MRGGEGCHQMDVWKQDDPRMIGLGYSEACGSIWFFPHCNLGLSLPSQYKEWLEKPQRARGLPGFLCSQPLGQNRWLWHLIKTENAQDSEGTG